jgi:hypothetical protein
MEARNWKKSINIFQQVLDLDPAYRQADRHLNLARRLEEERKQGPHRNFVGKLDQVDQQLRNTLSVLFTAGEKRRPKEERKQGHLGNFVEQDIRKPYRLRQDFIFSW